MLKSVKVTAAVLSLVGFVAGVSLAGGVGTTGAQFLKIGIGARPVGMGYAYSAVADDLNALYYNPAGLANQKDRQATASYLSYWQDVSIGFLAYSQQLFKGTFGVGLSYLSIGGIEKRSLSFVNDTNNAAGDDLPEGKFGASDAALYLSYANKELLGQFVEGLDVGASIKALHQEIDDESANTPALDLAALYQTPITNLNASLGVFNIGPEVKFVDEGDPLPMMVRLGVSYRMFNNKLLLVADADEYFIDERFYGKAGAEYKLIEVLSLRAGYQMGMDSELGGMAGLGTGIGFNIWNIQTDYAFAPFGELGDTHRISISTKF
ncbi:MAG: PorV/PorQ family protein [bacterium]